MTNHLNLAESLHPLERKILPFLNKTNDLISLISLSNLQEVEIIRALRWLENKKVIEITTKKQRIISLDINGVNYLKIDLPERRFLKILTQPLTLNEIQDKANLSNEELQISIGILKNKNLIELKEKVSITQQGKDYINKESLEELFLKKLPKLENELTDEEKYAFNELSKRKQIIKTEINRVIDFELTNLGKELIKIKIKDDYLEALTPNIIKSNSWKNKKFRHYNLNSITPKIYYGKKHPVTQVTEYVRRIWLDLGFKEMQGPLINASFWNFDALFTAQDHPVRELHDTLFIKNPKYSDLPEKEIVKRVKETHENGWTTGSKGWNYKWSEEEAKRNVLRTHTTVLSALTLSKIKKQDLPLKFFAVGKCFRNETSDWSHLFEFNQTEGIVIDREVTVQHLLGYLKEFFKKMGFDKVRFRPAYFPYTQNSIETEIFHPYYKKWIEIGGAGIFRPEVVKPLLGEEIPVLAWGLGIERIISLSYGLNDIRLIYKNDIKQLRSFKAFLR